MESLARIELGAQGGESLVEFERVWSRDHHFRTAKVRAVRVDQATVIDWGTTGCQHHQTQRRAAAHPHIWIADTVLVSRTLHQRLFSRRRSKFCIMLEDQASLWRHNIRRTELHEELTSSTTPITQAKNQPVSLTFVTPMGETIPGQQPSMTTQSQGNAQGNTL